MTAASTGVWGSPRIGRGRGALPVIGALAVAGVLTGALWAWLAPPAHGVIALARDGETRVRAYLGNEADHLFLGAALMVGMLSVVAVIAAVAVWQWRAHRGPAMAAALAAGAVLAGGAATAVGAGLVRLRYGGVVGLDEAPVTPDHRVHYFVEAPAVFFGAGPLQAALTIVFPAAIAALVYALCAVATTRDDLGGWPPVDPPRVLTAESDPPSAR